MGRSLSVFFCSCRTLVILWSFLLNCISWDPTAWCTLHSYFLQVSLTVWSMIEVSEACDWFESILNIDCILKNNNTKTTNLPHDQGVVSVWWADVLSPVHAPTKWLGRAVMQWHGILRLVKCVYFLIEGAIHIAHHNALTISSLAIQVVMCVGSWISLLKTFWVEETEECQVLSSAVKNHAEVPYIPCWWLVAVFTVFQMNRKRCQSI